MLPRLRERAGSLGAAIAGHPRVERLREERAYTSVDELVTQIGRDVDQVRSLLSGGSPPAV
jgi:hypothetical protein